jgi:hypothetical protein
MAKIKSRVSLLRAAQHNTRERQPLNADEARAEQNQISGAVADVMRDYSYQLPEKVRKNAVHAVELVFTASPEFSGNWDAYLEDCGKWAVDLFGEKNVLHIARHNDEMTPHGHVLVMPLKDGKLNAKAFIGGSRDKMAELQDDFFQKVGKSYGLERGHSRAETKARHQPHTLAATAAKLDAREKELEQKSVKLDEREAKLKEAIAEFKNAMGMTPKEIRELKTRYDNQTPAGLRQYASYIESKGFLTVGEYRRKVEEKKNIEQENKQQHRGSFHR